MDKWTFGIQNLDPGVLDFPNILYKEGTYATKVNKK